MCVREALNKNKYVREREREASNKNNSDMDINPVSFLERIFYFWNTVGAVCLSVRLREDEQGSRANMDVHFQDFRVQMYAFEW
jgi:hypothetical protein